MGSYDDGALGLDEGLRSLAKIRTTFETLKFLSGDSAITRDLEQIREEARYETQQWLAAKIAELEPLTADAFAVDWVSFRKLVVEMAERGILGPSLGSENDWLRISLPAGMSPDRARELDGFELLRTLLRELHARISDRAFLVDPAAFDQLVWYNFTAVMFALLASAQESPP